MAKTLLVISDLSGGRNGVDPPLELPSNQCVEAMNVDWFEGGLGRRRPPATSASGTSNFTGKISFVYRHVPGSDPTAAEFWAIDDAATPRVAKRTTYNGAFTDVTLADNITAKPWDANAASFNGKMFIAYSSAGVDRLHAWDPTLGTPKIRRVGLTTPAAPTVANTGAGAYAAVLRYYRVRWLHLNGTIVVRRGEASPSTSFTPSGAGTAARVTRPTAAGEDETHWEVEASTDNVTFYRLAQVVIGTTTYDDSAATTSYSSNTLSDIPGTYNAPSAVKFVITDGNRLLMAGNWTSGAKASRVWFTPVLGSSDQGDDERIPDTSVQKNYIDVGESDGGYITGLAGPLQGNIYVFKTRTIWKLIPTGDVNAPYVARLVTNAVGCIGQKAIAAGYDEAGKPALYFANEFGPYRLGGNGVEYLGYEVEDLWSGSYYDVQGQRNLNLLSTKVPVFVSYVPARQQVWYWIATVSGTAGSFGSTAADDPDCRLVLHLRRARRTEAGYLRGGWAQHVGTDIVARCAALYSNGSTGQAPDAVFYGGTGTATVYLDGTSQRVGKNTYIVTNPDGSHFQAYIKTRPLLVAPLGQNVAVGQTSLLARTRGGQATTITQTIDRDFGAETRTATCDLSTVASESRRLIKIEGSDMAGAGALQLQWGDGSAVDSLWALDAVVIPLTPQEVR